MKKIKFYTEIAYFLGLGLLAFGTALMTRADWGISMVVAPAYIVFRKVSQVLPFFTFGMAEYALQAALLVLTAVIMRKGKLSYLLSFAAAVIYGLFLDGSMAVTALLPASHVLWQLLYFLTGALTCAAGIALMFRTYLPAEAYELLVKELAGKLGADIHKVKTVYDCVSCLAAIALSFALFGLWHFEGVKWGTVVLALVNGRLIGAIARWLDSHFQFADGLPLRRYFP